MFSDLIPATAGEWQVFLAAMVVVFIGLPLLIGVGYALWAVLRVISGRGI